jgi:hypothetical protein
MRPTMVHHARRPMPLKQRFLMAGVKPARIRIRSMSKHHHSFVEDYEDMVAFGFSREVDEKSLMYYLQKFSDDDLLKTLVPRLSDEEINRLFEQMSHLMRKYLNDDEYHEFFLKDEGHKHHAEEA